MLPLMPSGALPPIRTPGEFAARFDVSRETLGRLEVYERLLRQWQKAVNLIAPGTLNDVWERHFADSAQLFRLAPPNLQTWVDLGSGAGFPGLVVAILRADHSLPTPPDAPPSPAPTSCQTRASGTMGEGTKHVAVGAQQLLGETRHRVVLVESNARKCAFLREVVRQTGIGGRIGVDILSIRIETVATQASLPHPDVVSARALAPLDRLLGLAAPLFTPATVGLFMKGKEAAAEIEAARKTWNFNVELSPSQTEPDGQIVLIRQPHPIPHKTQDEGK
jgi:16S rRNA (guanine527-N7)-methyltransferase